MLLEMLRELPPNYNTADLALGQRGSETERPCSVMGPPLARAIKSVSTVDRHSVACRSSVEIASLFDGATLRLAVEDNGIGFEPAAVVKLGHQGLANTRERAIQLGGAAEVVSRRGQGTTVVVTITKGG